jgi:hypothetical protein
MSLISINQLKDLIYSKLIEDIDRFVCKFDEKGESLLYYNYSDDVKVCVLPDYRTLLVCVIYQPFESELGNKNVFIQKASDCLLEKDLSDFIPALSTFFKCFDLQVKCDPLYFVTRLLQYHYHSETQSAFLILPSSSFGYLSIDDKDLIKIEIFETHCCKILQFTD